MTTPLVGMRNIKTAVVVGICLFISSLIPGSYGLIACFAAVICMQDSVEKTVKLGISRIFGTGIGGTIGILIYLVDVEVQNVYFLLILIIFGISASLFVCNRINHPAACGISCIVLVMVTWRPGGSESGGVEYAVFRMLETIAGVGVAILVNRLLPDFRKKKFSSDDISDNM